MTHEMHPNRDPDPMSGRPHDLHEAMRRRAYVDAVDALPAGATPATVMETIRGVGAGPGAGPTPSLRTVHRWRRRLRASCGDARSLVPCIRRGAGSRLPSWMAAIIRETALETESVERPNLRHVVEAASARIACRAKALGHEVEGPSHRTIARTIRECRGTERQHDSRLYRAAFATRGRVGTGTFALGIDEADLRDHLGAAGILTLGRDLASGRVVAAVLWERAEPAATLRAACGREARPSAGVVIRSGACTPDRVVVDNAREFHAAAFREATRELGVQVVFRPRCPAERASRRIRRDVEACCPIVGGDAADYLRRWFDADDASPRRGVRGRGR